MTTNGRRSRLALTCAVLAVGLLTGCTEQGDPPGPVASTLPPVQDPQAQVSLDDAEAHYGGLLREVTSVVDEVTGAHAEWIEEYPPSATESASGCSFSTERLRTDLTVDAATWAEIASAIEPVLKERGFAEPVAGDGTGGWLSLSAQDASGAVIQLRSKGLVDVDVDSALVTNDGACTLSG